VKVLAEYGTNETCHTLESYSSARCGWSARGFQSPADDRPTRARSSRPIRPLPAVQLPAVAVLIKESNEAGEHVAQLAGTEFVC
jgi:hypothetical protein